MDALIFDFDGVVVDSEPIHLMGFRAVLESVGLKMTDDEYYQKYLGCDDHDCILIAGRDQGREFDEAAIADLTAVKTRLVQRAIAESIQPLPGAVDLITAAARADVPLAVCSGALRAEIELAARTIGILDHFLLLVPAEDVDQGKPHPQGYELALDRLRTATGQPLRADRTLAIEDSPAGISAAKSAGMRVLAVTTSYGPAELQQADRIVTRLTEVDLSQLRAMFP